MLLSWDGRGPHDGRGLGERRRLAARPGAPLGGPARRPRGVRPDIQPRIAEWWRRHPGMRLAAAGVIWQELLLVLLGQRVTTEEAVKSWARIVYEWGEPAPGPCDLRLPPTPEVVAAKSYVDLHRFNVERRRADAILLAARRANRLEEAATMNTPDALTDSSALPGIGRVDGDVGDHREPRRSRHDRAARLRPADDGQLCVHGRCRTCRHRTRAATR